MLKLKYVLESILKKVELVGPSIFLKKNLSARRVLAREMNEKQVLGVVLQ